MAGLEITYHSMTHTDHRRTDPSVPRTAPFRPNKTLQSSQQENTSNTAATREGLTNEPEHPLPPWTPNSSATSSGYGPWGYMPPSVLEDQEDSILSRKKTFKDPSGNFVAVSIKAKRRGREASPAREEGFSPGRKSPGMFFASFKSQGLCSPKIDSFTGPPIAQMQIRPQLSPEEGALQAPSLDALSISDSSRTDLGQIRSTSSKSRPKTIHSPTNLPAVTESPNIEAGAESESLPVNEPRMPPVLEDEAVDKSYYIRSSADEGNEEQLDHRRFRLWDVSRMLRISRIQKANRSWAILQGRQGTSRQPFVTTTADSVLFLLGLCSPLVRATWR
jgi:hypothetical protein